MNQGNQMMNRLRLLLKLGLILVAGLMIGSEDAVSQTNGRCHQPYACVGMVIDSGDPVLIQMGHEMSGMIASQEAGTIVKPTEGPIANVLKMLGRENAGLSVVPSDMLRFAERSPNPTMRLAKHRLRFIMTLGRKVVHVIARKTIHRLEDLDGKRVVMGPDNTALWVVSNNLLHLHGATPSERIQLKPLEGITSVLLGHADAAFAIGDAPLPLIQKISAMYEIEDFRPYVEQIHMLPLNLTETSTDYQAVTVHYPNFAEHLDTVAILPTLISYDFARKTTPYFQWRCRQLATIGRTVRNRLNQLREIGHQQWNETAWELEAGSWKRDDCFFGTAESIADASYKDTEQVPATQ